MFFLIGLSIPLYLTTIRYLLMITGAMLTLMFYFITLFHVIKTFSSDPYKKIFWLIAIICVPVIGNVIYVIFDEMANQWQEPHGVW